jgi:hypothetical protein
MKLRPFVLLPCQSFPSSGREMAIAEVNLAVALPEVTQSHSSLTPACKLMHGPPTPTSVPSWSNQCKLASAPGSRGRGSALPAKRHLNIFFPFRTHNFAATAQANTLEGCDISCTSDGITEPGRLFGHAACFLRLRASH